MLANVQENGGSGRIKRLVDPSFLRLYGNSGG